jgi:hypothetical protein
MAAQFDHIADPRNRLRARLNWSLRSGGTLENPILDAMVEDGLWSIWMDFNRDIISQHIIASVEDEFGVSLPGAIEQYIEHDGEF